MSPFVQDFRRAAVSTEAAEHGMRFRHDRHTAGRTAAIAAVLFAAVACLAAVAIRPTAARAAESERGSMEHFITRRGAVLYEGERPWRFVGANMPGLVLPYDFTLRIPERMAWPNAWEQEDGFRTLDQMNLRCVRTWNLPIAAPNEPAPVRAYVLGPGRFNEEAFVVMDRAIALAEKYSVRMVIPLTAEAGGYLGGIQTYAAHRGKPSGAFYTDPEIKEDFKATIRYVLTRRNTVTGREYREEKSVLGWQFGNELRTAPPDWQSEMAAVIKQLAPRQLVIDGRDDRLPDEPDPNIDVYVRHYYGGDWLKNLEIDSKKTAGKRPLVIGEFGLSSDVEMIGRFLDAVRQSEVSGAMIWSMYFRHRDGGFYWHQIFTHPSLMSYHWPGFASGDAHRERDILHLLRQKAFEIRNEAIVPVPAPAAPELLPFETQAVFSWRGSTGAESYRIERSASKDGPWEVITAKASDAETAYRPLFVDESARPGQSWHYRVIAQNSSGESPPSNVVGPVHIRYGCLVDELQSLRKAHWHSPGLKLDNNFNGAFAEYLYRANGAPEDAIVYRSPESIKHVRVFAWSGPDDPVPLILEVSSDDKQFKEIECLSQRRGFEHLGTRTPSQLRKRGLGAEWRIEAEPADGAQFLRLRWRVPCAVDRVEIYY